MRIPEIQESDRGVGPRRLVDPAERPLTRQNPPPGFRRPIRRTGLLEPTPGWGSLNSCPDRPKPPVSSAAPRSLYNQGHYIDACKTTNSAHLMGLR